MASLGRSPKETAPPASVPDWQRQAGRFGATRRMARGG
jgi:hypothetical protein